MAERKSGPVKPPVIDLKARQATDEPASEDAAAPALFPAAEAAAAPPPKPRAARARAAPAEPAADKPAAAAAPEPAAEPAAATPPPPQLPLPPRPPARLAMPWSAISLAAAAGALLGAGLTYALANWIAIPRAGPEPQDLRPSIEMLANRTTNAETRLTAVEDLSTRTQVSLDATLVQLDDAVTSLKQSIADVEASVPKAQQPVDLSGIEQQLQQLEGRVTAIGAGASSADAATLADSLVGIKQDLQSLTDRLSALDTRLGSSTAAIAGLRTDVEQAKTAIAEQNRTLGGAEIGPVVKLPLIVSGLEAAFTTGRPYAAELDSLTALLPDIAVPEAIRTAAGTGLPRPDAVVARFDAAVPDILAGRTGASTGDWGRDAVEWAKALLALRPAEEIEGDTPEAIVSRLEGAVKRHDFSAAALLLAQLPEPMRLAAGEIGEAIAALADADGFVAGLRAQALAPAAEGASN